MPRYPIPQPSIVKFPGGQQASGKGLSLPSLVRWPARQGVASVTHPGFRAVVPPFEWDRRLLDLDDLGSAVTTGLSLRAKPVVCQMQDLVIWANGIDNPQVYEPTVGNVYDLGVAAPAAAPALADTAGAGSFAGEYTYWYRYKRSETGEYSALSEAATHTASGSNDAIEVTTVASAESGVDLVEIFRSKTGNTGAYRIQEQADTTLTYDDSTADSAIDITLVPPPKPAPGGASSVPVFDYIIPFQGRLWGILSGTNRVYWSEQNTPWLFPATNFMVVGPEDRDALSGFGVSQNKLWIFKERHTYYLASMDFMGEDQTVFVPDVRLVDDSTGAASQHAVTTVENSLIFMSGEGKMYQAPSERGLVAMERSTQLEETLKRLHTSRLKYVEVGYAELDRKVIVAIPTDENAFNNEMLVYDLTHNGWTTADIQAESLHEYRDTDGRGRLCFGTVRGDLCQFGVGFGFGARAGTISGSPTSGTKSSLSDTSASFDAGVVGLPIALFDAYYNLLQTNVVAGVSGTTLTCMWSWDTVPTTSHYYVIGGMFPRWKFGWMEFGDHGIIQMIRVIFIPTQGNAALNVALDDGELGLVDVINLADRGQFESVPFLGGKRAQIELVGLDGASPFEIAQVDVDVDVTGGGL